MPDTIISMNGETEQKPTTIVTALHRSVIAQIHKDFAPSRKRFQHVTLKDCIEKSPFVLSNFFSGSAVLFFALALQDPSLRKVPAWTRWVIFAPAAGLLNYVQIMKVTRKTLMLYLNYLKKLIHILRRKESPENSSITIPEELQQKSAPKEITLKSAASFLALEGLKWWILYSISLLQPSLAQQVDWLNKKGIVIYVRIATMFLLERSVAERVKDITDLIASERQKFRCAIMHIFEQNNRDAQDDEGTNTRETLLSIITSGKFDCIDPEDLLQLALDSSRNKPILLSNIPYYLILAATLLFTTIYISSNTGFYRATFRDSSYSLMDRLFSIFGDWGFGYFMALGAATSLVFTLFNRFKKFWQHEKRVLFFAALAIAVSLLSATSTLAVNAEEDIPELVGVILTAPGTTFDNANFLIELIFEWLRNRAFKSKNEKSAQYQRAAIGIFYEMLAKKLDEFSDNEFMKYIKTAFDKNPRLFAGYEDYLYKALPWAKGFPIHKIIDTLSQDPSEAMKTINASGRFGTRRKITEMFVSLIPMAIAGTALIPESNAVLRFLFDYFFPTASVPIGLSISSSTFFRRPTEMETPLLHDNQPNKEIRTEQKTTSWRSLVTSIGKWIFLSGMPVLIGAGTEAVAFFALHDVFNEEPESARATSKIFGKTASMITSGCIVGHEMKMNR